MRLRRYRHAAAAFLCSSPPLVKEAVNVLCMQAGEPWLGHLVARLVEEPDSTNARASSSTGSETRASSWADTSNSSSSSGGGSSGVAGVGLRKGGLVVGPMSRCVLAQYLLPPLLRGVEAHGHPPSSSTTTTTVNTTVTDGVDIDKWGYLPQALQDACVRLQQQQQQQQQPQSFSASSSASTPGPGSGASPNPYGYRSPALVAHAEQRSVCGGATGTDATALALLCCRWLQVIKNHSPTALLLSLINI